MTKVCLLMCVVFILQIPWTLQQCNIVQTEGISNYQCNSIQELENLENKNNLNVSVYNSLLVGDTRFGNKHKNPNLKIVLLEETGDKFGPNVIGILKDVYQYLMHNNKQIDLLPANLLGNLPIETFKLADTALSRIEPGAFANLKNLRELQITKSRLVAIPTGIFNNLPIEILLLSKNAIETIARNALSNLKNLKELYLDGNNLTEFQPDKMLTNTNKLEILWLNDNKFEEVDGNFLRGFVNLRELNLNGNRISKIFSYTFENLINLENLYLSHNKLLQLSPGVFPENGMPKLSKLYLNDNRLSYLTNTVLGRLTKLKYIRLVGNPWQCPCFDAILRWLGDYNVQQKCDRDYYSGKRPICVIDDKHPTYCNYNIEDFHYYRYSEVNNKAPASPKCDL